MRPATHSSSLESTYRKVTHWAVIPPEGSRGVGKWEAGTRILEKVPAANMGVADESHTVWNLEASGRRKAVIHGPIQTANGEPKGGRDSPGHQGASSRTRALFA